MSTEPPRPFEFSCLSGPRGRILYGDQRLVLVSAEALGDLRRELYDLLGPIMAHEVLFRFGFQDGVRAARQVRRDMQGAGPREILDAGPLLHTLEGAADVRIEEIRFGDEFEVIRGVWEDSFEAEQSIRTWGSCSFTACWILTGFASGYATEVVGRDLLCVERTCRAKGDEVCRFEILPAEMFPGLARKVKALSQGLRMTERMKPTITRLWERAYTTSSYLAHILQDSADAILTVDENEVIRTWNRGAEDLFGYTSDEVVGRHFRFLVPEDLQEQGEIEKVRREASRSGSLRNYATRRVTKSGEELHVSLTRTSIYDAHGKYVGASAILRDITERKRLVEQLIQAESLAEVGEMAAQVAHEIKNPLAGISGAIQLLAGDLSEDEPNRPVFREILDHIRRLDDIVLSLLRYTKRYRPERARTDLDLVLDSTLTMLETSPDFRGVRVHRDLSPDARTVLADPQQLTQVVMNLVLNAAQAGGREIRFRSRGEPSSIRIEVEDQGQGMPVEVLRQVFRPFFTCRHKGTGLGLAIARKIVEAHGGTITVESEEGRGTLVCLRLPRK